MCKMKKEFKSKKLKILQSEGPTVKYATLPRLMKFFTYLRFENYQELYLLAALRLIFHESPYMERGPKSSTIVETYHSKFVSQINISFPLSF